MGRRVGRGVQPAEAGRRLILLALPFLAFGLLWAIDPPVGVLTGDVRALTQALGAALAFLGLGAITVGVWLIRREDERIL